MLFHGTDIDFIDRHCPESLAYFSWVHLKRSYKVNLRGQTDKNTRVLVNKKTHNVVKHTSAGNYGFFQRSCGSFLLKRH